MSIDNLHTPSAFSNGATNGAQDDEDDSPRAQLDRLAQVKANLQARLEVCFTVLQVVRIAETSELEL